MIDSIPFELAVPLSVVLWMIYMFITRHERIARRRNRRL